jgi:hypothetical protein
MLNIQVDLDSLSAEFLLTKKQNQELAKNIILSVTGTLKEKWQEIASNELGKTRDGYIRSLIIGDEGIYVGFVKLLNQLPNMIEQGANAFDMKQGFSKSPKIKVKKDGGWYLTVPSTWATPSSIGELHSVKMPEPIYKVMKTKKPNIPLKLNEIPSQYRAKDIRPSIETKSGREIPEYKHKHSIYEGIVKKQIEGKKGGASHTQYLSFRRVSDKSDINSWTHPGFVARNFKDRALQMVDIWQELDKIIDDYLASIGK